MVQDDKNTLKEEKLEDPDLLLYEGCSDQFGSGLSFFGHEVTLTWSRLQNQKKWSVGAICSIFVFFLNFAIIIFFFVKVVDQSDMKITNE